MLISNEDSRPVAINSIDEPIDTDYFWILDLADQDFKLSKLIMLEEFSTPTLTINVKGHAIELPAEWNILVYSTDTASVDMVQVSDLTKSHFSLFLLDHKKNKVIENMVKVVSYKTAATVRTPSFNKNMMMCHPIGETAWVMVAPTDTYNKYLKDTITVGNFLH